MALIQTLHLEYFGGAQLFEEAPLGTPSADSWHTGFAALKSLTRLQLTAFEDVNGMLLCTAAAPALRLIEVRFSPHENLIETQTPSAETIVSLLSAAPAVQLQLLVSCLFLPPFAEEEQAVDALCYRLRGIPGFGSNAARVALIVALDQPPAP